LIFTPRLGIELLAKWQRLEKKQSHNLACRWR